MYETILSEYSEIHGLRWVRNIDVPTGPSSSILLGGRVTTAVIRGTGAPPENTEYAVYGIHLATDDELTFVRKEDEEPIVIRFVDCRHGSPTLHNNLEVTCFPDTSKRIVIPRGVAHLPMQLAGLITLNTPTLYWDYSRKFVSLELDVINVEKDRELDKFPTYKVCRFRLPDWAYPAALGIFKERYDPNYQAPFVFERGGKLYRLRKRLSGSLESVTASINGVRGSYARESSQILPKDSRPVA